MTVKIYGAGSIGNHLANAFVTEGFDVLLTDIDDSALTRAKTEIYPSRYGTWNDKIELSNSRISKGIYSDIVFIGTPPDYHLSIALEELENEPKIILIEKPLCGPDLFLLDEVWKKASSSKSRILVGYNHVVSNASLELDKFLNTEFLGSIQTISSYTREHWGGIFAAHPWLSGPKDSYLGFSKRGGGALCEHSHGLNMWQNFNHRLGFGDIVEVNAVIDYVSDGVVNYDKSAIVSLKNSEGIIGDLIQDVITFPTRKESIVQGSKSSLKLAISSNGRDIIELNEENGANNRLEFPKTRPDDFLYEVRHLKKLINGEVADSPLDLIHGIKTMCVIKSIFESSAHRKPIKVDYSILNQ